MTTLYTYQMELIDVIVNLNMDNVDVEAEVLENEALQAQVIEATNIEADELELMANTLDRVAMNIVDCFDKNIFEALAQEFGFNEALDIMEDGNDKLMIFHDCYDMEQVAEQYLEETGADLTHIIKDNEFYIDEESLLRDLYLGGDITEYYYQRAIEEAEEEGAEHEEARQQADDYEITSDDEQQYLEMVLDCASAEFLARYFDYEAYGRDMELEGTFVSFDGGMIEVMY